MERASEGKRGHLEYLSTIKIKRIKKRNGFLVKVCGYCSPAVSL